MQRLQVFERLSFLRRSVPLLVLAAFLGGSAGTAQDDKHFPEVPFVPTPKEIVDAMLKLADLKKGDVLYDLGCGDGRIVIAAAQQYGVRAVGVDINPERIQEATGNAKKAGMLHLVRFEENDLFKADISRASVVTLYLLPSVNLRLKPKLLKELRPGTRVVSESFDMGDWKPEKEREIDGRHIYLWTIPARGAAGQ